MKGIIKKLFQRMYFSIRDEAIDDFLKFEFDMQEVKGKYPNTSHSSRQYRRNGKAYWVRVRFEAA